MSLTAIYIKDDNIYIAADENVHDGFYLAGRFKKVFPFKITLTSHDTDQKYEYGYICTVQGDVRVLNIIKNLTGIEIYINPKTLDSSNIEEGLLSAFHEYLMEQLKELEIKSRSFNLQMISSTSRKIFSLNDAGGIIETLFTNFTVNGMGEDVAMGTFLTLALGQPDVNVQILFSTIFENVRMLYNTIGHPVYYNYKFQQEEPENIDVQQ